MRIMIFEKNNTKSMGDIHFRLHLTELWTYKLSTFTTWIAHLENFYKIKLISQLIQKCFHNLVTNCSNF